jgi:hypothetical protein
MSCRVPRCDLLAFSMPLYLDDLFYTSTENNLQTGESFLFLRPLKLVFMK